MKLILLLTLIAATFAIILPIKSRQPRCMLLYAVGLSETMKIDLNLPTLPSQGNDEYYVISNLNTQTSEQSSKQIPNGEFKQQYLLTPNVIYTFCIKLQTQRFFQNLQVEYDAETSFNVEHSEIKVPQSLLRKGDFTSAFEGAFRMTETINVFGKMQRERDDQSSLVYQLTQDFDGKLISLSIIQIAVILAAGVYQFFSLQNYLTNKQYI